MTWSFDSPHGTYGIDLPLWVDNFQLSWVASTHNSIIIFCELTSFCTLRNLYISRYLVLTANPTLEFSYLIPHYTILLLENDKVSSQVIGDHFFTNVAGGTFSFTEITIGYSWLLVGNLIFSHLLSKVFSVTPKEFIWMLKVWAVLNPFDSRHFLWGNSAPCRGYTTALVITLRLNLCLFTFTADFLDIPCPNPLDPTWVVPVFFLHFIIEFHCWVFKVIWFHNQHIYFNGWYYFLEEFRLEPFFEQCKNIVVVVKPHSMLCSHHIRVIKVHREELFQPQMGQFT